MRDEIFSRGLSVRRCLAGVCCLLLLTGCRLDLAAEAVVAADGTGSVSFDAVFDPATLAELDALGVDPTAELEAAVTAAPDWEVQRRSQPDGSLRVLLTRDVDEVAELGDVLRGLSSGLSPSDPGLFVDIEVALDDDGAARVLGDATFRAPQTVGAEVDGTPVGSSGAPLVERVAQAVDAEFRVRLPGAVVDHDGDRLEERTVVWELPVDEPVTIQARSAAPGWWEPAVAWLRTLPEAVLFGVGAAVVLLGVAGIAWRRSVRRVG